MRLIDADVLLDYLQNNEVMWSIDEINKGNETYSATLLYDFVKNQPTAYDVDKVLEQLKIEDKLAKEEKKRCSCCSTTQWEEAKGYANGISVAIDIVEGGGIDGLD